MKRLLVVCLVVMLSACGGAASQTAGTPAPTVDSANLAVSSFKATVSGSVSGDFKGNGSYFKQGGGGLLISLVATDGPSGATITIILPDGTAAGTYSPKSYNDAYDSTANKITGVGASFSVRNQTGGVDVYDPLRDSSLTLQSADPMTGSIHFKAALATGGEVDVQATFYQLISP